MTLSAMVKHWSSGSKTKSFSRCSRNSRRRRRLQKSEAACWWTNHDARTGSHHSETILIPSSIPIPSICETSAEATSIHWVAEVVEWSTDRNCHSALAASVHEVPCHHSGKLRSTSLSSLIIKLNSCFLLSEYHQEPAMTRRTHLAAITPIQIICHRPEILPMATTTCSCELSCRISLLILVLMGK